MSPDPLTVILGTCDDPVGTDSATRRFIAYCIIVAQKLLTHWKQRDASPVKLNELANTLNLDLRHTVCDRLSYMSAAVTSSYSLLDSWDCGGVGGYCTILCNVLFCDVNVKTEQLSDTVSIVIQTCELLNKYMLKENRCFWSR